MVNFVTSSYKPELLKPLVDKVSSIPEVVRSEILLASSYSLNRLITFFSCFVILMLWVMKMQVSIMNNVNSSVGNTSVGEQEYTLYGKETIAEVLRDLTFQISANSFFQTNTHQVYIAMNQLLTPQILNTNLVKLNWYSPCRLKFCIS